MDLVRLIGQASIAAVYRSMGSMATHPTAHHSTIVDIDPKSGSRTVLLVLTAEDVSPLS